MDEHLNQCADDGLCFQLHDPLFYCDMSWRNRREPDVFGEEESRVHAEFVVCWSKDEFEKSCGWQSLAHEHWPALSFFMFVLVPRL